MLADAYRFSPPGWRYRRGSKPGSYSGSLCRGIRAHTFLRKESHPGPRSGCAAMPHDLRARLGRFLLARHPRKADEATEEAVV